MDKIKGFVKKIEEKSSQLIMFYAMVLIEMVAMLIVALVQIAMSYDTNSNVPLFIGVVYLFAILLLTNRHPEKLDILKMLTLIPTLMGIIPYLYMGTDGGGIKSGMPIWMVLGLLMIFVFTKGIACIVLFVLTLVEYLACIAYTYFYMRDTLGQLAEAYYYQDNVIAIIAVSLSFGLIIKYQLSMEKASQRKIEQEKQKAQDANDAKTKFLTNMSHDIRTPMNAITGMAQIASLNIDDTERVRDCLEKINVSASMLSHLINNVLDMSEIESHKLALKNAPFELNEMIENLRVVLEQTAEAKQVDFCVHCENIRNDRLIGDAVRIKQVFMNLVGNSIKFTPAGGKVSLSICQEEGDASDDSYAYFRMEVSDTGIGMKQEFADSDIFKPFERAQSQYVNKTEGYGIGMSITKSILDVMGADLHIESEVGKGSLFRIHMKLLIDSDVESAEQGEADEVPELGGRRFLVVEDNDINMQIIEFVLERTNADIVKAWSAEEALEIFENSKEGYFDLVLLDIQLPNMNGYEAAKALRSSGRSDADKVLIWAMTANAFSQDVEKALQSGMNDHISKPIDTDGLYRKLKDAFVH